MNCDQVFDVLTRGPFPTGGAVDAGVETHLAGCHECRRLAEALRPAVELFHEAVTPAEANDLPGYRGRIQELDHDLTESVVAAVRTTTPRRPRRPGSTARLLTAGALGLAMGILLFLAPGMGMLAPPTDSNAALAFGSSGTMVPLNGDAVPRLVSLNLPADCRTETKAARSKTPIHQAGFLCCTRCHSAAAPPGRRPPLDAIGVVAGKCQVCHVLD